MSCSPFDLRDYFLKELSAEEQVQVDGHLKGCAPCREELDRLQLTGAALFSLRDEEIPQRIAFVSDKIFEPSPMRRWFDAFWGSTARLGFASAALLSCSIFYFAATRPAPAPNRPAVIERVTADAKAGPSQAEIQQQIQRAVSQAVADVEARQAVKTTKLVADLEARTNEIRRSLQLAASQQELDRKRQQRSEKMEMAQLVTGGEMK
jgi:hypothetical protein